MSEEFLHILEKVPYYRARIGTPTGPADIHGFIEGHFLRGIVLLLNIFHRDTSLIEL
ncbi:hypothetical protein [Pseudomonas gingeri]|nr:hypothetical protein [Pseudomonas gingeri]